MIHREDRVANAELLNDEEEYFRIVARGDERLARLLNICRPEILRPRVSMTIRDIADAQLSDATPDSPLLLESAAREIEEAFDAQRKDSSSA